MKLVLATPLYPPEIGGPATYAKALVEGLPARDIEVEVVKFSDVRRWPNVLRQVAYCFKIFGHARHADTILALDAVSVGWPALFANIFLRKKFVVKIVGDHIWEQGTRRFGIVDTLDDFPRFSWRWNPYLWFLRGLQFLVVRGADKIIVPSEYLKKIVMKWGILAEKIEVIYNAVPVDEIGKVPEMVSMLPRPLVVTAGRLVPWKHIDGVIDAIEHIPHASLAIVGDGPDRAALEKRAQEKLSGRALFTGQLSHADSLATIKSADIFVLNSSYEGLSHLLIEAQALGVPTIATNVGGNPEVITDEASGLLVPVADTGALVSSFKRVLEDTNLRARLGATAKESASRFSQEAMLSRTSDVLRELGHPMS